MRGMFCTGWRLIAFFFLLTTARGHSWVEQLMSIAPNGTFIGAPGFPRGNAFRFEPGFNDGLMTNLIPPSGRANVTQILRTDYLCKDTQRKQVRKKGSPRLQASAGAAVALRWQENGHVTLPENQVGKPHNRGTVYVYGTTEPRENERLLDVHKVWNKEGTGGDRRGVLLSKQNFDDGRCYQINSSPISTHRQGKFPHVADQLMGADLWCQQDIKLPSTVPSGKPYTLYWIWDWPTAPRADPALPSGKQEIYTTCMDVDVLERPDTNMRIQAGYIHDQSLNQASIPSQFAEIFGLDSIVAENSSPTPAPTPTRTETESEMATGTRMLVPFELVTVTSFVTSVKTVFPTACLG